MWQKLLEKFYYRWRRHVGWFPIQFCMGCHKPYWGGLPRYSREWVSDKDFKVFFPGKNTRKEWVPRWLPSWQDFCSKKCNDENT
jgi:hypothetical protein